MVAIAAREENGELNEQTQDEDVFTKAKAKKTEQMRIANQATDEQEEEERRIMDGGV